MTRFGGVLLVFAGLAVLVGAQAPSGLTPEQQLKLLERNRELLRTAVASSLELGEKSDHLERAGACNRLARVWAGEVERAARQRESARASELGGQLSQVVERGVANNLRIARRRIESGSPMEQQLLLRRDEALDVLRPLEQTLGEAARSQRDLDSVVAQVSEVRRLLEDVAKK